VRTSGTGAAGTTDIYTITFDDDSTSQFTVTNGANGSDGTDGDNGSNGRGITTIQRTSGTGAAGTTDIYTITYSDSTTSTFNVYNGADGEGSGDMLKSVYDTDNDGKVDAVELDASIDSGGTKPVAGGTIYTALAGKQQTTDGLTAETAIAAGDYFPFYDVSVPTHRKSLWSNIVSVIRTALFSTSSGILKADGSGGISAAAIADYPDASTSAQGVVQLSDSTSETSSVKAATPTAVKSAYDLANAALPKAGGTMTGDVVGHADTDYTTARFRNITLSTSDPSGGSNGDIWIKYTA